MKKFLKRLIIVFAVLLSLPIWNFQNVQAAETPETNSTSSLAFDEKSGQVLYSDNADQKVAIGSITKVLSLYLVTKAIHQKTLSFDDNISPTKDQAEMTQHDELTNVSLDANKTYTVRQLYDAAWIVSSNSAAMMLAQKVGGTEQNFVKLMRKTAKSWGIKDAEIYNVSGLNNSYLKDDMHLGGKNSENKLSANDIAIIVKHILDQYPEVLQTTSKNELTFPSNQGEKTYKSLNLLLKGNRDYQEGYEFDGLKTGTTKQAGDSFVGTYPIHNTRVVTIVMDVKGNQDDKDKRFRSTQNLAHYVNENFEYKKIVNKSQDIRVTKTDSFKSKNEVKAWVKNDFNSDSITYKKSDNDLGFAVKDGKKQTKLIATNLPEGNIPYAKVKNGIKKIEPKKTGTSVWNNIVNFFKHLF
ncbi:D-alanyl-D-alanine carboxypeptidase family protein [Companilactobacillus mishanensis]|uniref:D-alanyl-D-alanine carboxypeptidase family protein n=1 Tax=Companilactobacillus mishanensis TaxID=2486008 RepID=UPI00129688D9|nr:D-alanyl-D-alanine carboxypeptidase family protein [Companilactobacillus mishanensis]MQS90181.1 D-alanyl-D-alanine carboxypeptidase [Companilactobacillus mishanensis]